MTFKIPNSYASICRGLFQFNQFCRSVMSDSVTPWAEAHQAPPSITNSQSSLKLMSIASVMPSSHLSLCHHLPLLLSVFPRIRVFSSELVLSIRGPKFRSFIFSISPSNEYSGLVSFRMDWLELLTVQGTLKSLFQHHSSKASILECSAFFMVQLSHPYMTTGKTIALTRQTFIGKAIVRPAEVTPRQAAQIRSGPSYFWVVRLSGHLDTTNQLNTDRCLPVRNGAETPGKVPSARKF